MARRQACHILGSTWGMSQSCAPVEIGWSRVNTYMYFFGIGMGDK